MSRVARPALVCLLLVAGMTLAADRGNKTILAKFQSYENGVLKVKDFAGRDWDFTLDKDTAVVSATNPKLRLPLKNAFQGVNKGRNMYITTQGEGDDQKVVAVQIGQGGSTTTGKPRHVITCKFQSYEGGVLKVTDLDGRDWEFKLDKNTPVVSVTNPRLKLPLKNAFQGVNQGRILRVMTQGNDEDQKVTAVQIGQGGGR
jgi:hypothetical protein